MPFWKSTNAGFDGEERIIYSCACFDTGTRLEVHDLEDGLFSIDITDRPDSFRRRLWNFLRSGNGGWEEIILRPEDARALAEELNKLADKYEKK